MTLTHSIIGKTTQPHARSRLYSAASRSYIFQNLKLAFKRTLKVNDDLIIDHLSVDKAQGRSLMATHNISPSLYRCLCVRAMNNDFPLKLQEK